MSAVLFPMDKSNSNMKENSRIPIPSSPQFRRASSLRFKTPFEGSIIPSRASYPNCSSYSLDTNQMIVGSDRGRHSILKRGNSFMERGERRIGHGVQTLAEPQRHQNLNGSGSKSISSKSAAGTPKSPSRIRSLSLSLSNGKFSGPRSPSSVTASPKTPPTSPEGRNNLDNWDTESINSITSITSVGSCDHATIARNGTTFSGRSMKYVFHCNQHSGQTGEDYLTPTQRVHRQVKKLKYLLEQAKKELEEKDSDILKLTKEVVELRLYKAALNSPEDRSNSSDAVTVKENHTDEQLTPDMIDGALAHNFSEMNSSYTDSGHFEDFSKDDDSRSPFKQKLTANKAIGTSFDEVAQHQLISEYERRIQELVKTHEEESCQLKQKHNDKVEELLQRITEINTRYWQLVPELDLAKEKIKELEQQLEEACHKLEQEERQKALLEAYSKSPEPTTLEEENKVLNLPIQGASRVSVPELLNELQVTKNELEKIKDIEYASTCNNLQPLLSAKEALSLWVLGARKAMYRQLIEAKNKSKIDPEITLQFLKSAIYYFLTDRENSQGHLKAIQSILGFSPNEISNIDKARLA